VDGRPHRFTDGFYWDENDKTRLWSKRFFERMHKMPSKSQANTYAAVMNYLKALDAAKTDEAEAVSEQLKATPADYFGEPVMIRQTGRVAYDLTVYEVKKPEESKYAWDYYKPVRKVSAEEAFRAGSGNLNGTISGVSAWQRARCAQRIRRDNEQTTAPKPHSGLQGESGACCHQGRSNTG